MIFYLVGLLNKNMMSISKLKNYFTYFKYAGAGFISIFLIRNYFNGPTTNISRDMKDRIVIVTGSSAGIGKETARDLLNKGAKVIFACRDKEKTLKVIDDVSTELTRPNAIFMQLNLASFNSVNSFIKEFSKNFNKLDILINNAGLFNDELIITEDGLENTLQTNHIGHFALTGILLKYLKNSDDPRVINVSSRAHRKAKDLLSKGLSEKNYEIYAIYGISKAANILFTEALKDFSEKRKDELSKIKTVSLHPGVVHTEFTRSEGRSLVIQSIIFLFWPFMKIFFKDEKMGAQTTLHCCYLNTDLLENGAYYSDCKVSKTYDQIRNFELDKNIRKITYEAVKNSVIYKENQKDKIFLDYMDFFK